MNIDALLKPISEESPCGEELEYDIEFMELENSLIGKVEQQFGDITIPAEPPNWLQVEKQAI
ncbi:type VI secretion system ImpA family N-terminal domain-containing protein, partial [Xenorhabdus bovienii]|uniref:type VI secretion system ImpA family N-terminal domain-containing protein n=2 Tax=Xenorhabdus TaxID=626 RepID=UPI0023B21E22